MLYMLDTNTVSYLVHKRSAQLQRSIDTLPTGDRLCVSLVTEAELLYGLAIMPKAQRLAHAIDFLLAGIDIVPWTSHTAKTYAALRAQNRRLGLAAGDLDLLISAHAIAEDATLVTSDAAIRKLKGGLVTVNWANDITPN